MVHDQSKCSLQNTSFILVHLIGENLNLLLSSFCPTGDYGGAVVTHSPPTSEVGGSNPEPYVGNLVVTY